MSASHVVRWVDRLGRNYADVTDTIREFIRRGVIIFTVINNMTFDGSTTGLIQMAVRDALIALMAATDRPKLETIKGAQKAGIANAKAKTDVNDYKGRKPNNSGGKYDQVIDLLVKGASVTQTATETGLTRQTIYRIKDEPVAAEKALAMWGQ